MPGMGVANRPRMAALARASAALLVAGLLAGCSASRPATCRRGDGGTGEVSAVAGRVLVGLGEVIVGADLVDHSHDGDSCDAVAMAAQRPRDGAPSRAVPSVAPTPRSSAARPSTGSDAASSAAAASQGSAYTPAAESATNPAPLLASRPTTAPTPAPQLARTESTRMRAETTLESVPVRPGRWILVRKSARTLSVFDADRRVKSYPVVLGADPVDAKVYEGDRRTPEGEYHVVAKHLHPDWQAFLLLDYPNPDDRQQYSSSRTKGRVPLRGGHVPGTGGSIGIHGTVDDALNRSGVNWTYGCISLLSADIQELYKIIPVGTPVVIQH